VDMLPAANCGRLRLQPTVTQSFQSKIRKLVVDVRSGTV